MYSTKFKSNGSKIAWVSIRLPNVKYYEDSFVKKKQDYGLFETNESVNGPYIKRASRSTSFVKPQKVVFHKEKMIQVAVVDLALRKIGLDNLVLVCNMKMNIKLEFLNRVSGK